MRTVTKEEIDSDIQYFRDKLASAKTPEQTATAQRQLDELLDAVVIYKESRKET